MAPPPPNGKVATRSKRGKAESPPIHDVPSFFGDADEAQRNFVEKLVEKFSLKEEDKLDTKTCHEMHRASRDSDATALQFAAGPTREVVNFSQKVSDLVKLMVDPPYFDEGSTVSSRNPAQRAVMPKGGFMNAFLATLGCQPDAVTAGTDRVQIVSLVGTHTIDPEAGERKYYSPVVGGDTPKLLVHANAKGKAKPIAVSIAGGSHRVLYSMLMFLGLVPVPEPLLEKYGVDAKGGQVYYQPLYKTGANNPKLAEYCRLDVPCLEALFEAEKPEDEDDLLDYAAEDNIFVGQNVLTSIIEAVNMFERQRACIEQEEGKIPLGWASLMSPKDEQGKPKRFLPIGVALKIQEEMKIPVSCYKAESIDDMREICNEILALENRHTTEGYGKVFGASAFQSKLNRSPYKQKLWNLFKTHVVDDVSPSKLDIANATSLATIFLASCRADIANGFPTPGRPILGSSMDQLIHSSPVNDALMSEYLHKSSEDDLSPLQEDEGDVFEEILKRWEGVEPKKKIPRELFVALTYVALYAGGPVNPEAMIEKAGTLLGVGEKPKKAPAWEGGLSPLAMSAKQTIACITLPLKRGKSTSVSVKAINQLMLETWMAESLDPKQNPKLASTSKDSLLKLMGLTIKGTYAPHQNAGKIVAHYFATEFEKISDKKFVGVAATYLDGIVSNKSSPIPLPLEFLVGITPAFADTFNEQELSEDPKHLANASKMTTRIIRRVTGMEENAPATRVLVPALLKSHNISGHLFKNDAETIRPMLAEFFKKAREMPAHTLGLSKARVAKRKSAVDEAHLEAIAELPPPPLMNKAKYVRTK